MENQLNYLPDKQLAADIVQKSMGESVLAVDRFSTGGCHFVYDVTTESQHSFVVRIARPSNKEFLVGATYWHRLLKPRGVPLPSILYSDIEAVTSPFPYMIIERLPGEDLGTVYPQLSRDEKRALAVEMSHIQEIAGTLPPGKGYGFVSSYESDSFLKTWTDVLLSSLARSRRRIQAIGAVDSRHVDRVAEKIARHEGYFSQVKPRCFLDDTTTRNVIVDDGKLSGIVDVDFVCFGDYLFPIALTRMSLLNTGFDLDYIDFWCEAAHVTEEQREVLQFYTALFCVDFMGELGQTFNQESAQAVKAEEIERLSSILDMLLNQI
ncbi:MAG TPA: aminoglycoside phosphotransferase family protein [Pyrinomonadaceae bacterium]|nr:aminoglycoside phosphotransferase family protein [Pyrinomonadaceae bacterium]